MLRYYKEKNYLNEFCLDTVSDEQIITVKQLKINGILNIDHAPPVHFSQILISLAEQITSPKKTRKNSFYPDIEHALKVCLSPKILKSAQRITTSNLFTLDITNLNINRASQVRLTQNKLTLSQ